MKKCFIFLVLLSSFRLYAQQPHCHTDEYIKAQILNDPSYKKGIEAANQEVLNYMQSAAKKSGGDEVYTIPVVFHIVYNNGTEDIDDEQIFSQIQVLNEDYRRLNADADETPDAFADLAADALIEFKLAQYDEDGNPTTGITRTETDITSWDLFASSTDDNFAENVKDSDDGGQDGWDRDCYLNIWVCDLNNEILGYATPPGGMSSKDGVVIGYQYIGLDGVGSGDYDMGRTATHEVGHWLGLSHVWGDDGTACSGSDFIADTPNQTDETYGCPSFPKTDACTPASPGVMFMNYMDYTNDDCMNMFTEGQVDKMRSVLESSRDEIVECTKALVDIETAGVNDKGIYLDVFPNPSAGIFTVYVNNPEKVELTLEVYNIAGQMIYTNFENAAEDHSIKVDMSKFSEGIYQILVYDGKNYFTQQLVIVK
ncbi:MAG: T9SS type A sorting domain-containing protein [Chitinophagales bacterium]|nr:T9SS type A sorting domain-containing protein [Chitinophagales bacterium]